MESGRSLDAYGSRDQWDRLLGGHPALVRLSEWMRANDPLHLTLSNAAELACLERQYFSAIFRRYVGISFVEWRRSIRTNRAAHLMTVEGLTVEEVVLAVGYKDRRSLERAFKTILGTTPKGLKQEWSRQQTGKSTEAESPDSTTLRSSA
jgi:transcriptional regulator GlxA family with amidase domain